MCYCDRHYHCQQRVHAWATTTTTATPTQTQTQTVHDCAPSTLASSANYENIGANNVKTPQTTFRAAPIASSSSSIFTPSSTGSFVSASSSTISTSAGGVTIVASHLPSASSSATITSIPVCRPLPSHPLPPARAPPLAMTLTTPSPEAPCSPVHPPPPPNHDPSGNGGHTCPSGQSWATTQCCRNDQVETNGAWCLQTWVSGLQ